MTNLVRLGVLCVVSSAVLVSTGVGLVGAGLPRMSTNRLIVLHFAITPFFFILVVVAAVANYTAANSCPPNATFCCKLLDRHILGNGHPFVYVWFRQWNILHRLNHFWFVTNCFCWLLAKHTHTHMLAQSVQCGHSPGQWPLFCLICQFSRVQRL